MESFGQLGRHGVIAIRTVDGEVPDNSSSILTSSRLVSDHGYVATDSGEGKPFLKNVLFSGSLTPEKNQGSCNLTFSFPVPDDRQNYTVTLRRLNSSSVELSQTSIRMNPDK